KAVFIAATSIHRVAECDDLRIKSISLLLKESLRGSQRVKSVCSMIDNAELCGDLKYFWDCSRKGNRNLKYKSQTDSCFKHLPRVQREFKECVIEFIRMPDSAPSEYLTLRTQY
ncbi:MAG: hypothetical protein ACI9O2_000977, partial [Flammeovirgaceae bacterium]